MKKILIALIALVYFSCNNDDSVVFKSSMDLPDYWKNSFTLSADTAFSGTYSSKIDATQNFSFGFSDSIKKINSEGLATMEVNFKALMNHSSPDVFVICSIDSLGNSIFWSSQKLVELGIKENAWNDVYAKFDLPKVSVDNTIVSCYVWSAKGDLVYVDDLSVKFK